MNNSEGRNKRFSFKWFLSWGAILLGSLIMALGMVIFIAPYKIIPGGVYGIGIVLNYIFPSIQVGTYGLIMDIPLLLAYFYFFGRNAGLKTVVVAIITPLLMNFFQDTFGTDPALMFGGAFDLSNEKIMAALVGGALLGLSLGIIFANGATSGGTDIIGIFVSRFLHVPLATALLYIEGVIVITGAFVIGDWKLPLYSLVLIFVFTRLVDFIVAGSGSDKLMYIISAEHEKIKQHILGDLGRGGTYIKAKGMYTGEDKNMIFVVVSRSQVKQMHTFVKNVDPRAFIVVLNANETLGEGFKEF